MGDVPSGLYLSLSPTLHDRVSVTGSAKSVHLLTWYQQIILNQTLLPPGQLGLSWPDMVLCATFSPAFSWPEVVAESGAVSVGS